MAARALAGEGGVSGSSTELGPSEVAAKRFAASRIAVEPTFAELGREVQTRGPPGLAGVRARHETVRWKVEGEGSRGTDSEGG